jgi:hypothetical protein
MDLRLHKKCGGGLSMLFDNLATKEPGSSYGN